jgi:hypothetical protein
MVDMPIWAYALVGVAVAIIIALVYFVLNAAKIAKNRARKMVKAKRMGNKQEFKWICRVLKKESNDMEASALWNKLQALRARRLL